MGILDQYRVDAATMGGTTYTTRGFSEEQLQQRDAILDMPLQTGLTSLPRQVVDEFTGEIYTEQHQLPPTSLRDYQSSHAQAFDRAFREDNLVGALNNFFEKQQMFDDEAYAPDPTFTMDGKDFVYDLVMPEFYPELNKSQSYEELIARTQYYGKLTKDLEYLDNLGAEGIGYRVAAFLADAPVFMATEGLGLIAKLPQMGRVAELTRAAESTYLGRFAVAGTIEGGFETLKMAVAPHSRDEVDILLAVGLGGALGGLYRPASFSEDVQTVLTQPGKDLVNATAEAGGVLTTPASTLSKIDRLQVNVASVLRASESPTLSRFGDEAFLDVTRAAPTEVKAAEVQTAVIDGINGAFDRRYNPLYKEFLEATNRTSFGSRYRLTAQDDFYEVVGQIANQPNKNWDEILPPELVQKIRTANKEMAEEAYDILARNDHPLFTSGEIERGDWFRRQWNRGKLVEDLNTGRLPLEDARALFTTGIINAARKGGLSITTERATEAGKKFVDTLRKASLRAGESGFIMQDNAFRSALEDIRKYLDLNDNEMAVLEQGLQSRREARGIAEGTASSTKRRSSIDLEATYTNADGTTYNLSDYVENNAKNVWQAYARSMGGDTALRKLGFNSREELAAFRNKVVKELEGTSGRMSPKGARDLANLDAVIGDFLNISGKHNPDDALWKGTRLINNLTRASKLGSTWFAMSAELAQVIATNGVADTIKAVPAIRQMIKGLKNPKTAGPLIEEIQSYYGLANEILQMPSAARYDEMLTGGGRGKSLLDTAERFSDRAAEAAYMLGGTKSGTSALEALFAAGANNKIVKMAGQQRLGRRDRWYLEQMGFQGDDVNRLLEAVRTSGSPDNKYVLSLANWEDQELAMKFAYGVRRTANIAIQRGNIGDAMGKFTVGGTLAKDNFLGSLGLNLRNYTITAWNKQMSRTLGQISRGPLKYEAFEAYKNILYQMVIVGGLGYAAKNGTDYMLGAIDEKEFDRRMQPQAWVASTFNMTTFASMLPAITNYGYSAYTGENLVGTAARGNTFNFLGASGSYMGDVANIPNVIGKAFNPDRELTANDIRKTLSLLPLSSLIGVKQMVSGASQEIGK